VSGAADNWPEVDIQRDDTVVAPGDTQALCRQGQGGVHRSRRSGQRTRGEGLFTASCWRRGLRYSSAILAMLKFFD